MKTTKTFEIEISRHNVTPAQFLAYLRTMQKKHPEMGNDFDLSTFTAEGWSANYSSALPTERPCECERITDKPYEKQTYIRNFDGSAYNEIIEFQFDDEKTGFGYYYTVQIDVADEDREANTAENVAAIIRRREATATQQEAKAAKIEAEADEAERKGYTAEWWIEARRVEAANLRMEAADTREAIDKANEAQKQTEATEPTQKAKEATQDGDNTEDSTKDTTNDEATQNATQNATQGAGTPRTPAA